MKKVSRVRSVLFFSVVLIIAILLSACNKQEARLPTTYIHNPGAAFSANINDEDTRRVLKCAVIFEVIDEAAATELTNYNYVVRNAVLMVLGELTIDELTINKDMQDISQRLISQVNLSVQSKVDLVIGAYFTEFVLS